MPLEAPSAARPSSSPATDDAVEIGTSLGRLLDRAFEHLAAVMPGLPQLGAAMVLLVIAIAVSQAREAAPGADVDAVSATVASFDVAPF